MIAQLAQLEQAVLGLRPEQSLLTDDSPLAASRREELSDRVVDLLAARAWSRVSQTSLAAAADVAQACAAYVVAEDVERARARSVGGGRGGRGRDTAAHERVVHALTLLTRSERFDAAVRCVETLVGEPGEGRLREPWLRVRTAVDGLGETRHEWVGREPRVVAAGGWVLVDRVGRLLASAALIAEARATCPERGTAASAGTDVPRAEEAQAVDVPAQRLVTASRRYTWNHLRVPPPEAATPIHLRRTSDLVSSITPDATSTVPGA